MDTQVKDILIMLFFVALFMGLVRITVPLKIKRVLRKAEHVKNNLDNKNVRKFIIFLRTNTLISVPEVANALCEVQILINEADHIEGNLKLDLYNVLMRRRIMGIQEVNPIYVDKNGNRV